MIALRRILVATDFGEASNAALNYARELARTFGATLHVLNVAENVVSRYAMDVVFVDFPDAQARIEEAARTQVNACLTADDRETLDARAVLRTALSPARAIVAYAEEERMDLIVMGTHGRGGVAHFLLGSVAERVVQLAPCPVLTVRSSEHRVVLPDALVAVATA